MIERATMAAVVPVSDVERGVDFYGTVLGLELLERNADIPDNPEALFKLGAGLLAIYKSVGAGQSRHTLAAFVVDDVDAAVEGLRGRGVTFEDYDLPGLKTENGIAQLGDTRGAWFRDPDGNILAVEERAGM